MKAKRLIVFACLLAGGLSSAVLARGDANAPATQEGAGGGGVAIAAKTVLSTNGSPRATAYGMSNKIVTRDGRVFVAWLDHVSQTQIRCYDIAKDAWGATVNLGTGTDNHGGPALTMDSNGCLHVVFGPHHGPLQYRRSVRPLDIEAWTDVETFGDKATYPSLICGPDDMLYCAYRSSATNPWRVFFQSRRPGGPWSKPAAIVDAGVNGYAWFGNGLAVGADGALHLAFGIYDQKPKGGKAAGYLRSDDRGKTWRAADGAEMALPVTPESKCFIEQGPSLDMRCASVVLDPNGAPWLAAMHLERSPKTVVLWRYADKQWQSIDLLPHVQRRLPGKGVAEASITFDRDGKLYALCAVAGRTEETVLLVSSDMGKSFDVLPVSDVSPGTPNWLASIERPFNHQMIGVPAMLYMHGGRGVGVTGGPPTEVVFVRLKGGAK